jgi:hypothetical protein
MTLDPTADHRIVEAFAKRYLSETDLARARPVRVPARGRAAA